MIETSSFPNIVMGVLQVQVVVAKEQWPNIPFIYFNFILKNQTLKPTGQSVLIYKKSVVHRIIDLWARILVLLTNYNQPK